MSSVRTNVIWIALGLFLMTAIVYLPSARFDFVDFDDPHYVTGNEFVNTGLRWENVVRAFSGAHSSNWHPVTWISHMLDCEWFGLKPGAHHVVNFLLHGGNAAVLFLLLHLMTGAMWRSAFVAALFALHPLHVESVAWISERKDVLSTFFGLISAWFYVRYVVRKAHGAKAGIPYVLSLLLFALGLMSKPMLVTLPFVFLLLDFWPLGRETRSALKKETAARAGFPILALMIEKIPFFILSLISCVITFVAQREEGAVRSLGEYALSFRLTNVVVSYARYLGKTVWPTDLAVFYPMPEAWSAWQVGGALLVVVGGCIAAVRLAKTRPYLFTGWFWFLGTLVPVIGLVQVSEQSLADRYSYIPLIGIFAASTWLVCEVFQKRLRIGLSVFGCLLIVACALLTSEQLPHWRNTETLFSHAIAVTDKNYLALNHLSTDLMRQGRMDEARSNLMKAVQIRPQFYQAQLNLGHILATQGQLTEAETHFREAARLAPDSADARYNLGNVLRAQGKVDEAIIALGAALQLEPHRNDARSGLALLLAGQGKMEEATRHYEEVARLHPEDPNAQYNLATAHASLGNNDQARQFYEAALQLRPDFPEAHLQLASVFAKTGDKTSAIRHLQQALQLRPDFLAAEQELQRLKGGAD